MRVWKHRWKRGFALVLTAAVIGGSLESRALPVWAASRNMPEAEETFTKVLEWEEELPKSGELLEGYLHQRAAGELGDGASLYGNAGGTRLTGDEKRIYEELKRQIQAAASGARDSTVFSVDPGSLPGSEGEVDAAARRIIYYLLMDCPYDLYWYDKTTGNGYEVNWSSVSGKITSLTFSLAVGEEYQKGTEAYRIDTSKTKAVNKAADTAKQIVKANEGKTSYEKLAAYLAEIKRLASYNNAAAGDASAPYGNPWQLIWVFDGDPSTKVVCEGYAKAFQYLCDLSSFYNAACYTVTGTMDGGNHMWNIVTLNGSNYLVDATNCDDGTAGAPDKLFLAGAQGSVEGGYAFSLGGRTVTYQYDPSQKGLLGDVLKLASDYYENVPGQELKIQQAPTVNGKVTFGEPANNSLLTGGAAVDGANNTVQGSFQWVDSFYREAGTPSLKVVFIPADSRYEPAEASVNVKVEKKTVTVKADPQSKAVNQPDPELTYTAEGVVDGCPLQGALTRQAGESVGTYAIEQGDLTDAENPNYEIQFTGNTLTITAADCNVVVNERQNIRPGTGEFTEPVFTDENGSSIEGTITYTYSGQTYDYAGLKNVLAGLAEGSSGTIAYTFVPASPDYASQSGEIAFTMSTLTFTVGGTEATAENAVTIKKDAVYGDSWSEIVKIGSITAGTGAGTDSDSAHFTLRESGRPDAGDAQSFQVLYNGTIEGKTYTDEVVLTGKADVAKRTVTAEAGSCRITKVYDRTRDPGTASGELAIQNLASGDEGLLTITVTPGAYPDANVNGQKKVAVTLALEGEGLKNYELLNDTLELPGEIKPKSIAPVVKVSGSYSFTGSAVTPALTVSDGTDVLAETDYEAVLSNNKSAGTAKVSVSPKAGGNYTWSPAVEASFTIDKGNYTGTKTMAVSARPGETASFNLSSVLPAGYKLGSIRVEDRDRIFTGTPSLSGSKVTGSLVNDSSKAGKKAVITVPVTETADYQAFELTLTVNVLASAQNPGSSNNNNNNNNNGNNNVNGGNNSNNNTTANGTDKVEYSLSMETGISKVPTALSSIEDLNTTEKIESKMKQELQKRAAGVASDKVVVYDVVLMVNINGTGWKTATKDNFPQGGLTVVIPYPEGTDRTKHDFVVSHMFTEEMNGHKAGEIEYPSVTKTGEGLEFKVNGLSPISVGWSEAGKLNDPSGAVKSPKTADMSPVEMYLGLLVLAASALAGLLLLERRRMRER